MATVRRHCSNGHPLTIKSLIKAINEEVKNSTELSAGQFASDYVGRTAKYDYNTFSQYIRRLVSRHGFAVRRRTISQSVPAEWDRLAKVGAARTRWRLRTEKCDRVIAADEVPMLHQPLATHVLAPRGCRRVGTAGQVDEKEACTLMLSIEYVENSVLEPCLIFTGVPGAILQQRWRGYAHAQVMFTTSHWMTRWSFLEWLR
eukprot:GHVU01187795.1.p1 GENE.GHVU01187795.1~~GHVU01187795.1.p1  ORF type:complete len:202 (+),score=13.74 GHVU01187795.1:857-1462(+)